MASSSFSPQELRDALAHVIRGNAAGIDGVKPRELRPGPGVSERLARARCEAIVRTALRHLEEGAYHFKPVISMKIPAGKGKVREIFVPTVQDRMVLRAGALAVADAWDALPGSVLGGRPGASVAGAIKEATAILENGPWHVLKVDVQRAFPSARPAVALDVLRGLTGRGDIIDLFEKFYAEQGERVSGLGAGIAFAPLALAALIGIRVVPALMNVADHVIVWFDDALVFVRDRDGVVAAEDILKGRLGSLGMSLHPQKTMTLWCDPDDGPGSPPGGIEDLRFLGWAWVACYPIPSPENQERIAGQVLECVKAGAVKDAIAAMRGWAAFFKDGADWPAFGDADIQIAEFLAEHLPGVELPELPRLRDLIPRTTAERPKGRRAGQAAVLTDGLLDSGDPNDGDWREWAFSS